MNQNSKMLVGALGAAELAITVSYGLLTPQQASNMQGQANQALGTTPVPQQPAPAPTQETEKQPPAPVAPAPQSATPASR